MGPRALCAWTFYVGAMGACEGPPKAVLSPATEVASAAFSARPIGAPPPSAESPTPAMPRPCVDPAEPNVDTSDKGLVRSVSATSVRMGQVSCAPQLEVWRDRAGRIRVCTVERASQVHGVAVAAGAYTWFHESGRVSQSSIATAQRFKTGGAREVLCTPGHVVFSANGALESCIAQEAISVGDVHTKRGETIGFHESGQLRSAVIARPHDALGATIPASTRLEFHRNGAVAGGWLRETLTVAGRRIRYEWKAYPSGQLKQIELGAPETISGHAFPERARIWFRENGTLLRAEYIQKEGFMIHGEPWTDTRRLQFDCAERIVSDRVDHWQSPSRPRRKT